jgi:hypothetical protein
MQKLARDEYKRFLKGSSREEARCKELAKKLADHGSPEEAWNREWESVYKLAESVMNRILREGC